MVMVYARCDMAADVVEVDIARKPDSKKRRRKRQSSFSSARVPQAGIQPQIQNGEGVVAVLSGEGEHL